MSIRSRCAEVSAWLCVALALMVLAGPVPAAAEKRVALVIGNAQYAEAVPLKNPVNDAVALSAALERLGFEVHRGLDMDLSGMRRLVRDFGKAADGADLALFFYAGHGVQVAGKNYLLPVDAKLEEEADLDFAAIEAELVMRQMDRAANTKLVLLDACRNNPFERELARSMGATRSANALGRGLAQIRATGGSLIAFATDPGAVAFDGDGMHSPFTAALLKHIETPGLEVNVLMTRVRADVFGMTNSRQRPWTSSSLIGEVYLSNGAARPTIKPVTAPDSQTALEIAIWNAAEKGGTAADYRAYLTQFPEGAFAELARNRIAVVEPGGAPAEAAEDKIPDAVLAAITGDGSVPLVMQAAPGLGLVPGDRVDILHETRVNGQPATRLLAGRLLVAHLGAEAEDGSRSVVLAAAPWIEAAVKAARGSGALRLQAMEDMEETFALAAVEPQPLSPPTTAAAPASAPDPVEAWVLAREGGTEADFRDYLNRFPDSPFAELARLRLAAMAAPDTLVAAQSATGAPQAADGATAGASSQIAATAPQTASVAAAAAAPPVTSAPPADPALTPEEIEQALGFDRRDRREVQERLTVLDYDTRGVDGIFGPGSRAAIRAWQARTGQEATGFLTAEGLKRLKAATEEKLAAYRAEQKRRAAAKARQRGQTGQGTASGGGTYQARASCGSIVATARDADRQQAMLRAARQCAAKGGDPGCCTSGISVSP